MDTSDIVKRLRTSLFLWEKGNALSVIEKKPDLFGFRAASIVDMSLSGEAFSFQSYFVCSTRVNTEATMPSFLVI